MRTKQTFLIKTEKNNEENSAASKNISLLKEPKKVIRTCRYCSKSFNFAKSLKKHLIEVHDRKSFDCTKCSKRFLRQKNLLLHNAKEHTKPEISRYKCPYCDLTVTNILKLNNHISDEHVDPNSYKLKKDTLGDFRKNCGPKPKERQYKCTYCPLVVTNILQLNNHIQQDHVDPKTYKLKNDNRICVVGNCNSNVADLGPQAFFPVIRANPDQREKWFSAIQKTHRGNYKFKLNREDLICEHHFSSGEPSNNPDDIDYCPSIFLNFMTSISKYQKTVKVDQACHVDLQEKENCKFDFSCTFENVNRTVSHAKVQMSSGCMNIF